MDDIFKNMGIELNSGFIQEMIANIPGIDEAMAFGCLLKTIGDLENQTVVFDTAPTGHTLRFLNFPNVIEKLLTKILQLKDKFEPLLRMATTFAQGQGVPSFDEIFLKITQLKSSTEAAINQFRNPELTTFVAVCIPEFLSLWETERLVQELNSLEIDINNVVVNQVLSKQKWEFDSILKEIEGNTQLSTLIKDLTLKSI